MQVMLRIEKSVIEETANFFLFFSFVIFLHGLEKKKKKKRRLIKIFPLTLNSRIQVKKKKKGHMKEEIG